MGKRHFSLLVILAITIFACVPESKKILTEVDINVSDPIFQSIMDHQYKEELDSILKYFNDENPTYRYLAARAFASFQEEKALDSLNVLLDDPVLKVRSMAAYSIGQIGKNNSEKDLIAGFRQRDTMSVDNSANGAILEAIGKLGNKNLAAFMVNAEGYRDNDTLLLQGRAKSLYRYALRGITSPTVTDLAVKSVRNYKYDNTTRLFAANYLARANDLDIEKVKFQIAEAFVDENNVNIKMALASALRHTSDKEIQTTLLNQLELDQDYRIKCNIIRTLSNYDYINSAEKITGLIKDKNIHIARSAVAFLDQKGIKEDVLVYRQIAKDSLPWQVKADLYTTINNLLPYYYSKTVNATRWHIQKLIESEEDTLALAHYIRSLGNDPGSYQYLLKFAEENNNTLTNTAIIETLGQILASDNFNGTFQGYSRFHRRKILEVLQTALTTKDEGMVGAAADAIANPNTFLTDLIDSTEFLFEAKSSLSNPAQIESIHAIDRAIGRLRGVTKPKLTKTEGSKLPNWSVLNKYNNKTYVIVKTTQGAFTIELYMNEAPGSVFNFLELSKRDYYDDKIFHRVVPNFVIQTGSPRGDNYGGEDYVIKSDVPPLSYADEGYVGMASAGLHTESTQWFVTHSPTLHLDGKYSIFGKVVDGMNVIHKIQVGDKILDIIISNI
ncbi:peptidylprolyl isomerase [bacterium]|nr:peptidylprolyl isomerase [bacterium]